MVFSFVLALLASFSFVELKTLWLIISYKINFRSGLNGHRRGIHSPISFDGIKTALKNGVTSRDEFLLLLILDLWSSCWIDGPQRFVVFLEPKSYG